MKLAYLSLFGFRGIRTSIELNIPTGFMVISGRNGSGKSTLCDAIEYTLTGQLTKYSGKRETGETVENYLWWRGSQPPSEKSAEIRIVDNDLNTTSIKRDEFGMPSLPQKEILEMLIDVDVAPENALEEFLQTCLIRDEFIAELSLDIPERRRFMLVETTVGISDFSPLESVAAASCRVLDEMQNEQQKRYDRITEEANALAVKRSELASRLSNDDMRAKSENELRNTLRNYKASQTELLYDADETLRSMRQTAAELQTLLSRVHAQEDIRAPDPISETQTELDNAESRLATIEADKKTLIPQLDSKQKELDDASKERPKSTALAELVLLGERLQLNDGHCFLCGSEIDAKHYESHLQTLTDLVSSENVRFTVVKNEHEALISKNSELENSIKEFRKQTDRLRAKIHADTLAINEIVKRAKVLGIDLPRDLDKAKALIAAKIEKTQRAIDAVERDVEILRASTSFDKINALEDEEKKKRGEGTDADKKVSLLGTLKTRAANIERTIKRVSGESLDQRLAALAPLLKELYIRLRPHTEWRELEYLIRGDVRRFLSLRVGDDLNPAFMFSSGQRRAAGLAFLLAINLARTWSRLNTIILDDPVQHVDDYRALHFVEVLASIRRSGRQVICTVEDDALADLLCRRLRSESHGDGIRIEMEYTQGDGASIKSIKTIGPMPAAVLASAG